jgi:hypothetical protein
LSNQSDARLRGLPYAAISKRAVTRDIRRPLHPGPSEIEIDARAVSLQHSQVAHSRTTGGRR